LATNDANDLKILHSSNPVLGAGFVSFPARRPDSLEKRCQVTDREKDITVVIVSRLYQLNPV
jgi:hypothetical protein